MYSGTPAMAGSDPDPVDFSFNNPQIDPSGDVVERLLVSYRVQTTTVDTTGPIDANPLPYGIGVSYTPNPQLDPGGDSVTIGDMISGDALFTDVVRWRPVYIVQGIANVVQWVADSGGVITVQGRRTIQDKVDARLRIAMGSLRDFFGGSEVNSLDVAVSGWVYVKILVKRA